MEIPLNTINSKVAIQICAEECGAKCCDFYLNDFHVRINMEDYKRLKLIGLDNFVVWDHGDPQLAKQPGGKCIFLHPETKKCSIYPIRPLDCRNYPYYMSSDTIPDHCLLFHRSSDKLKRIENKKTSDVPEFDKSLEELTPVEEEYIQKLQEQPSIDFDTIFPFEKTIETDFGYYSIVYQNQDVYTDTKELIKYYERRMINEGKGFQAVSLLGLNSDFSYTFHIMGVMRSNPNISLPGSKHFPSKKQERTINMQTLQYLIEWTNQNAFENLLGGLVLPLSYYKIIQDKINV